MEKYNLNEGNEALNRVLLMMRYDLGKTFSENVVLEQTSFENKLDKIYSTPKSAEEYNKQNLEMMKGLYDWFSSLDAHDWLSLIEISTGVLGMIPTPLSPLLLGISTLSGVADAALYYSEGDKYMGSMMFILSVIPGGELLKCLKGSKVFIKRGAKGTKELIKKYKSGAKLTKNQINDLIDLGKTFADNSVVIKKSLIKELTEKLIVGLSKKTPKYLINLILILKKLGVIKLSEIVLPVGGLIYGFDKLYLYVFRDSVLSNQSELDNRTRNELRAMINKLLGYDKEVNEFLIITAKDALEKSLKNNVELVKIAPKETIDEYFKESLRKFKEESDLKIKKESQLLVAPTLNDVKSGKKVIKKGQKGESVKEIQKMLNSIGYDYLISDMGNLKNWNDGDYGESTKLAVETFQDEFSLKTDGIVGKETLNKLIDEYNKK
jgi:hypothetical protein